MTTLTHINSVSFTDLEGRTTAHSRFVARDLDATKIIDADNGMTLAMIPGYVVTITTYDAIGLNLGKDMILKYALTDLATRATKFDMLPVNTTSEATEILRKVINRAERQQVQPEPSKKIVVPVPGPGHPTAAIHSMVESRNRTKKAGANANRAK